MLPLAALGCRISILGPSNSGKSTLANQLGAKIMARVCHLDQIAHQPNTAWQRRPSDDFVRDHDQLMTEGRWVIDGNYSVCMPQRFARSTGVIWLDFSFCGFLWRYLRRCWRNDKNRAGTIPGALSEFSFGLIKFTFWNYPRSRKKYAELLLNYPGPVLKLSSLRELNRYYRFWELKG